MNISSAQLMKLLASGVRPADGNGQSTSSVGSASQAFADLLKQAQDGGLASELPVTLGSDAEGISLDGGQLARLSIASDQLETSGIRTALVKIDGQQLVLDVHARQVTGRAEASNGITGGIDGVLDLGDARSGGTAANAQQSPVGTDIAPSFGAKKASLGFPSSSLSGNQDVLNLLASLAKPNVGATST